MGLLEFIKRKLNRWESIGSWRNGEWSIEKASEGLLEWLRETEQRDPSVWDKLARSGRRFTIHGEHYDYRVTTLPGSGPGLVVERRRK